ncbi:MAG: hypothetical protein M3P91_01225, partial [Actinomycetota bacterium]|nr:hypothetical protein [Actinomycetota bacterium]
MVKGVPRKHLRNETGGGPLARDASISVGFRHGRIIDDGDRAQSRRWPELRQARRARGVSAVRQAERRDRHGVGQLIDVNGFRGTVSRPRGSRRSWLREVPLHEFFIGSLGVGLDRGSRGSTAIPGTARGIPRASPVRGAVTMAALPDRRDARREFPERFPPRSAVALTVPGAVHGGTCHSTSVVVGCPLYRHVPATPTSPFTVVMQHSRRRSDLRSALIRRDPP